LARADLPTGTVTFLFTDVEGSTRLLREHGDAYAELLAEHHRLLRGVWSKHGGVEVDTQGDAFFVAFARASDAVAAATDVRSALERTGLRVRIGIHAGEPLVTETGYVGIDVHRAARIAAVAHGGQVVLSERVRQLANGGFSARDLGRHRLKDLGEAERLYQLGEDEFPPLRSLDATNLPTQPTPLVGRERELHGVLALLRRDGVRLLTLTGPGGTGKTRLALQVAAELVGEFGDGVFWVPLASLSDATFVESSVVQVVGSGDDLADAIDEKRMLLLLDNFEQVLAAGPALAEVLARCPNLQLLVTSRSLLNLRAERAYEVAPLRQSDAMTLFLERAVQSEPHEAVAEICRRLDGLPLAIELAAARTRVLSPPDLLERLDERLTVLTGGPRDLPERQRTLRATIEWSHELLSVDAQRLFALLAIFPGSFDLEAAAGVCGADPDDLGTLVEQSLVRRWGSGRFGMLETIREFALERLQSDDERDDVAERHAEFFRDLALRAEPKLAGPTMGAWLERVAADHANVRDAVMWFLSAGRANDALQTAVALARYLEARGHFSEGRAWLAAALVLDPDVPAVVRGRATYVLGRLVDSQSEYPEAERLYREAVAIFRAESDDERAVDALVELPWVVLQQGRLEEADGLGENALSLARELGDAARIANALVNRAATLVELELYGEALRCYEESLELRRALGEARAIAISLASIGWTALLTGDLARARAASAEAVELMRANADRQWVGASLHTLGAVALAEHDLERASAYFMEALADARELGDRRGAQECLVGLAAVAAERGDAEAAARLDGLASRLFAATGAPPSAVAIAIRREQLAAARAQLGDERWDRAFEAGRWLSLDNAAALASPPGG